MAPGLESLKEFKIDHAEYLFFCDSLNYFNTETFLRPLPLEDLSFSYVQLNQIIRDCIDSKYLGENVLHVNNSTLN